MFDRIELQLIGITYNQIESGVYAVILQEVDGNRRLPIIIGFSEAQSIECKMQEVKVPRPLTHDLLVSLMEDFRMTLREVWIYKLPSGVFAADLTIESARGELHTIDARSSDAIAIAIRTGAPIFTSDELLNEVGVRASSSNTAAKSRGAENSEWDSSRSLLENTSGNSYSALSVETLEKYLEKAVENEDYEEAGEIKKELDKRKQNEK